jgi:hypothetical protein
MDGRIVVHPACRAQARKIGNDLCRDRAKTATSRTRAVTFFGTGDNPRQASRRTGRSIVGAHARYWPAPPS